MLVDAVDYDQAALRILLEEPLRDNVVELAAHLPAESFFRSWSVQSYFHNKARGSLSLLQYGLSRRHLWAFVQYLTQGQSAKALSTESYRPLHDFLRAVCRPRFFFAAPIARFVLELTSHTLLFVLFCICMTQRHAGDNDSDVSRLSGPEIILLCFSLGFFSRVLEDFYWFGKRGHWMDYFKVGWYIVNAITQTIFAVFWCFRLASLRSVGHTQTDLHDTAYGILSLTCVLFSAKFILVLALRSNIGILTKILRMMVSDLMIFVSIFGVLLLGLGGTFNVMFGHTMDEFSTLQQACVSLFLSLLGVVDLTELSHVSPVSGTVLLALYWAVSVLLLVNLLVAVFASTYEEIHKKAANTWAFIRCYRVYLLSFLLTRYPPPLNLVANAFTCINYLAGLVLKSNQFLLILSRVLCFLLNLLTYLCITVPVDIFVMVSCSCLTPVLLSIGVVTAVAKSLFAVLYASDLNLPSSPSHWTVKSVLLLVPLLVTQTCFIVCAVVLPACCKGMFDWIYTLRILPPTDISQRQTLLQHNDLTPEPAHDSAPTFDRDKQRPSTGDTTVSQEATAYERSSVFFRKSATQEIYEEDVCLWRWLDRDAKWQLIPIDERENVLSICSNNNGSYTYKDEPFNESTRDLIHKVYEVTQSILTRMSVPVGDAAADKLNTHEPVTVIG
eukprot:GILK01015738.1.p1 GENE.GILK01015738.1~~GILK01015738.1.p1  ORF type:complete len:670 (-),score=64.96 GILK01015738.1:38-2047(-)